MRVSYDGDVDQPVDVVWSSLTDVDSVLAALPGAALGREGDAVSGSLKCRFPSHQVTYRITARAEAGESEFHSAVLAVSGTEARGSGTIAASLTVAVRSDDGGSRIEVSGDVEATGRGERADEAAWRRVIESHVNALLPPPAPEPAAPPPRPPLTVAPPPAAHRASGGGRSGWQLPLAGAFAATLVLLLVLRRRRRRRG
jgi:carbon monoxide dehydrogenase subunit G